METDARDVRPGEHVHIVRSVRAFTEKFALSCTTKISHACIRIQHNATGERILFGNIPKDEAIACEHQNRRLRAQLRHGSFPGA